MTENNDVIHTNLAAFDAHVLAAEDYAEIPELDDEWFATAELRIAGRPIKRGRPKLDEPKKVVNLRLSRKVIDTFRAGGPGWQTRINAALEAWIVDHPDGAAI